MAHSQAGDPAPTAHLGGGAEQGPQDYAHLAGSPSIQGAEQGPPPAEQILSTEEHGLAGGPGGHEDALSNMHIDVSNAGQPDMIDAPTPSGHEHGGS
jgi:hypothetical protein